MTQDHLPDPRDVLLRLSAENAGKVEIDEFLRTGGKSHSRKCFKRIMKRIKHADLYRNGKLTSKAKIMAFVLLLLLALAFSAVGFCFAKLTGSIISARNMRELFAIHTNATAETTQVQEIDTFLKPYIRDLLGERVLVKSRLLCSVEYLTENGKIYYSQRPLNLSEKEEKEPASNEITVFVDKYPAKITSYLKDGEKFFDIHWSDKNCHYSIYCAESIEQAVELASSVYTQTSGNPNAESTTQEHSEF